MKKRPNVGSPGGEEVTGLQEFQLREYEKIAEAHFKTNELISSFFRYYLAIMTIPVTVIGTVATLATDNKFSDTLTYFIHGTDKLPGMLLLGTAALGVLMMSYILNLRFDALLYARQVNGIRKSFFDSSELSPVIRTKLSVLPVITSIPKYLEREYFEPVVFTFALINSTYVLFGAAFWSRAVSTANLDKVQTSWDLALLSFVGALLFHWVLYCTMAKYREKSYLKSRILGIDIDGTIGNHTHQYCAMLKELTGIAITADQITTIPVSKIKGLSLTREDHEIPIFHEPRYWIEMKGFAAVEDYISNLRTKLGYQVVIFTDRSWPAFQHMEHEKRKAIQRKWKEAAQQMLSRASSLKRVWRRVQLALNLVPPILVITEGWLKTIGVPYDRLVIDSVGSRDSFKRAYNRFSAAATGQYRVFIEDHWQNAIKLASHCEFVFLLDYPYNDNLAIANQSPGDRPLTLPGNVIRVKDWDDLYRYLSLL